MKIVEELVRNSNKYITIRKEKEPHLACWKKTRDSAPFSVSNMYHFLAILYYFGIVKMPAKSDYWSTHPVLPKHPIVNELGMTRDRFQFMFRHFHTNVPHANDIHNEEDEVEESEEELAEGNVTRDEREQDVDTHLANTEDIEEEQEVNMGDKQGENRKEVWFEKIRPLIDHFRDCSFDIVHTLGTLLSLDEMMIRFQGRSVQTHGIKNKPIGEGFKWFVLTTFNGFVVNFTPDGRTAEKENSQEYEKCSEQGKIESMIMYVTNIIKIFCDRQNRRIGSYLRSTRNNKGEIFDESIMDKFCLAMDNYFTVPTAIKKLRDENIGVVGTARFKRNWPPKELKDVNVENCNFNDFYYTYDDHGSLVARWMDNNMVFLVSTVHRVGQMVQRVCRRPRLTPTNKRHVRQVWGKMGKVSIFYSYLDRSLQPLDGRSGCSRSMHCLLPTQPPLQPQLDSHVHPTNGNDSEQRLHSLQKSFWEKCKMSEIVCTGYGTRINECCLPLY